jgi:hypothetical protein
MNVYTSKVCETSRYYRNFHYRLYGRQISILASGMRSKLSGVAFPFVTVYEWQGLAQATRNANNHRDIQHWNHTKYRSSSEWEFFMKMTTADDRETISQQFDVAGEL